MTMNIGKKILDKNKPSVLFEIVPPPLSSALIPSLESLYHLLDDLPIDALNIPEVRDVQNTKRYHPIKVARSIKRLNSSNLQILINHHVAYDSWEKQKKFFKTIYVKNGIRGVVLVGKSHHDDKHDGPTVSQAAEEIQKACSLLNRDLLLGAITIQTREREAERVWEKSSSGVSFFTTQVITDPQPIKKLLAEYAQLCSKHKQIPKRIFLTFVPVSKKSDIEFLQLLRIAVPKKMQRFLFSGWLGVGLRSIKYSQDMLENIMTFIQQKALPIPIGLNIGYIMRHNFELSKDLAETLVPTYQTFYS